LEEPLKKENTMRDYGFVPPVNKDLEELLKKARMTMKSSELNATSDDLWPAYTHEGYYSRGFQEGFRAGQEAGLKLAQDVMDRYIGPNIIVKALRPLGYDAERTEAERQRR
jgi:flagellar biosynthesis/type III secretory pathway protein FliH